MNILGSNRSKMKQWYAKKSNSQFRFSRFSLSVLALLFSFLFLLYLFSSSSSSFTSSTAFSTYDSRQCNSRILDLGERFLFYAPHSGFNNQLSEFKNAILMAGILNRTLVIPPILDHHAVALGSCPKFRVLDPREIRFSVWEHMFGLLRDGRYVSMADIVDISSLASYTSIKAIDFRIFAYLWCGMDLESVCSNEYHLKQCGRLLAGLDGNVDKCLHAVDEDCRTTVWTYQNGEVDGVLDLFQPNEQLKKKKKVSYVRRRRDVYQTLGPDSEAESATVLAFGSLFTAPYKSSELYIDIHEVRGDQRISSLMKNIEHLPFVPEILSAGKEYIDKIIKAPFLCAQLRLLDGQFKNHWKATFLALKQKLDSILQNANEQPIRIFVMTDLPESNWTGSYLGDLVSDSNRFKLFFLKEHDELVVRASEKVMAVGHGWRLASSAFGPDRIREMKKKCAAEKLPDILLYIEETVCSCASLGFIGTAGSTIAESIELMSKYGVCSGFLLWWIEHTVINYKAAFGCKYTYSFMFKTYFTQFFCIMLLQMDCLGD
ncbi:O-fucosyltransferase 30-like [Cucurbita pepo subsp. pepo]|uniref:O-fucosyltransferase 30-like n=1 Tax=Cucurbita pepo subsp. pepo TaxID=3664 RepID=UPI000C9D7B45|nr:O-fucosyltransferase 30-like [Cucurbita pepo subsp. pepo]